MRVGVDFGSTHTVVAVVDRGDYPVVSFDAVNTWPSLIAADTSGPAGRNYRLAGLLAQLKSDLQNCSNTGLAPGETVEAAISVPANASSAQRLLTLDDLGGQPVGRWSDGPEVEERYVVAPSGAVEVTLTTQPAGFKRTFRLERRVASG